MDTEHRRAIVHGLLIILDRPHTRRPYDTRLQVVVQLAHLTPQSAITPGKEKFHAQ
jgi:hypothetical protein